MYVAVLIGLAGFLIFSILAAITFGNADLSLKDVYSVIAYKLFHIKVCPPMRKAQFMMLCG